MFKKIAAVASLAVASIGSALAAVPADVTTALEGAGTDVATIGGAVLVVFVGIFAFKAIRRAM